MSVLESMGSGHNRELTRITETAASDCCVHAIAERNSRTGKMRIDSLTERPGHSSRLVDHPEVIRNKPSNG